MTSVKLNIDIPDPVVYDLDDDKYDVIPNIRTMSLGQLIPYMHYELYEALLSAGVGNLQVYDAISNPGYPN